MNSTEIKEKQKLVDARKKIETEMEKFREHEKEFKLNKLTKTALQDMDETESKFVFSSDESNSYGGSDNSDNGDDISDGSPVESGEAADKDWLTRFLGDSLKKLMQSAETEMSDIRNKKKGKKSTSKELIGALSKKLEAWKKVRDRAEELAISMDYLETGSCKELRSRVRKFLTTPDEDELRVQVLEEIEVLIETSE